jgi:exopolyphosphatase/guanosine-5'-triphosphate,3'-diphosphate pyrophosphatase
LSAGVDADGVLRSDALDRTMDVLEEFTELMRRHEVRRSLLVATSAVRDAKNREEFIERAGVVTGGDVRVLSGVEEATYSFHGATDSLAFPDDAPPLICDIGGGSTELAVRVNGRIAGWSMQLGCVRVTERALGPEIVTPEREERARAMIRAELDRAFEKEPALQGYVGRATLIGLAGTVASTVQLERGLYEYDRSMIHGFELTVDRVTHWREVLVKLSPAQRLELPGMVKGREDVLAAGLYVLEAIMARFQLTTVRASESDILDGVVATLQR